MQRAADPVKHATRGPGMKGGAISLDGGTQSLGDRCCLALTLRSSPPEVLAAGRAWGYLDLPIRVRLLR